MRPLVLSRGRALALFCVLIFACAETGRAALAIKDCRWTLAKPHAVRAPRKEEFAAFSPPPNSWRGRRLEAVAFLETAGSLRRGVLLRYALSARMVPAAGLRPGADAVWTLPFFLDERKIPKVNGALTAAIDVTQAVQSYFKRLSVEGRAMSAVKIDVMIEPQRLDDSAPAVCAAVLTFQKGSRESAR